MIDNFHMKSIYVHQMWLCFISSLRQHWQMQINEQISNASLSVNVLVKLHFFSHLIFWSWTLSFFRELFYSPVMAVVKWLMLIKL